MATQLQRDVTVSNQSGPNRAGPNPTGSSPTGPGSFDLAAAPSRVAVSARGLSRSFYGRAVLDPLDLDIAPGEFVALLGRSGSGKTTLLRALGGLDHEVTGDITVPEALAVVFQEPRLLPWKKVAANVVLGLPRGAATNAKGADALAEVGLADHAGAWPITLSGGEAQRVSLARALVREPELLLLDEPFGALDALTRIKVHALVRRLVARHQPAVLLVTHDVDEAVLLADRVLVLTDASISLDLPLGPLAERSRRSPRFAELRSVLLVELGVLEDDDEPVT